MPFKTKNKKQGGSTSAPLSVMPCDDGKANLENLDDSVDEKEYVVLKVVAKRLGADGRNEFKIKWKGYKRMTWEPVKNLSNCTAKINDFEEAVRKAEDKRKINNMKRKQQASSNICPKKISSLSPTNSVGNEAKRRSTSPSVPSDESGEDVDEEGGSEGCDQDDEKFTLPWESQENKEEGFDKGFEAEEIIAAGIAPSGEMVFLMTWRDSDEVDLVRAKSANIRCPQVVIAFYEKRVYFSSPTSQ